MPCDLWLFGMLKVVWKDREFDSNDEIEEAMTKAWDEVTFDEVPNVCRNWMIHLGWAIAHHGRECIIE
jgi:hypothetical protein